MAEESDVQSYLTKHKISCLFEVPETLDIERSMFLFGGPWLFLGAHVQSGEGTATRSHQFPHKEAADLAETQEEGMQRTKQVWYRTLQVSRFRREGST